MKIKKKKSWTSVFDAFRINKILVKCRSPTTFFSSLLVFNSGIFFAPIEYYAATNFFDDFHKEFWSVSLHWFVFYDVLLYMRVFIRQMATIINETTIAIANFADSFLLLNLDFKYFIYCCTYDTNVAWIMFFENLSLIRTIPVSSMVVHILYV